MAKRFRNLNPEDKKKKEELLNQLRSKGDTLNEAIHKFNLQVENAIAEFWTDVENSLDEYNDAVLKANEFAEQIEKRQQEYYDSCEDRWKQGHSGSAYQEWISSWTTVEVDQIYLDQPTFEEVEEVEINIENFENLSEKVAF